MESLSHAFITSTLDGGEWSAYCSSQLIPGERSYDTFHTGGWADLRAGLDAVAKRKILLPTGNRILVFKPVISCFTG
jgi:hypothetical protein